MSDNGEDGAGLPPFGDEYSRIRKEEFDRGRRTSVHEISGYRPASPVAGATASTAAVPQPTTELPDTNTPVWHHGLTGQLSLSGDLQDNLQEQREREERFIARCYSLSRSRERFRYRTTAPSMATPMSPSTSPRLPSPPPIPEVQIGPQSPSMNAPSSSAPLEARDPSVVYIGATDRIRPGTKAADMAAGPPLVDLEDIDSPFALQTYLKALWHHHTAGPKKTAQPITHETALEIVNPPKGVDRSLWLYELCRFIVQMQNDVIVGFINDRPPCTADTCPEMRASEWQYLCAVHDPPKSCCAMDYSCHTLDWAANTLTSQKHFPSRLTLGSEGSGGKQAAERQITNIFRRAYRIFAHAWFQHRRVFWSIERKTGHYILFKTVCDVYALIPTENYTIPPEAEGLVTSSSETQGPTPATTMKKPAGGEEQKKGEGDATITISTGATTRRHKHTPSTGSVVTVIHEGEEEDEEDEPESQPMIRETPTVQNVGSTELRDPHANDEEGDNEKPTKPAEPSLEKAIEDFTIAEPVQEKDDKGEEPKFEAEGKVTSDEGKVTGEDEKSEIESTEQ